MIPEDKLASIQRLLHELIRSRGAHLEGIAQLELPKLELPLPTHEEAAWFPVPGMYGGFKYWFEGGNEQTKLITESWCRVVGGSGQRHEITQEGCRLIEEGFV